MRIKLTAVETRAIIQSIIDNIDQYIPMGQPVEGNLRHNASPARICARRRSGVADFWTDFSIFLDPKGPTFWFHTNNIDDEAMDIAHLVKELRDLIDEINQPALDAVMHRKEREIARQRALLSEFGAEMYTDQPSRIDTQKTAGAR